MLPGFLLFAMMLMLLVAGWISPSTFYVITAILTMINMTWVANLAIFSGVGAWRMRSASSINWHSLLEQDPVTHFVVLPNYQEDEAMLRETLENLGRSPSAEKHMRIVLAMEAREGPNTRDKAERLMAATGHLFEDMMATYHPPGIAGEVAGKSSNTQWAFRQLWKKYGVELHERDLSSVFMTVGDADTLWHPQFFSAVTFESQRLTEEERSWSIWQPPVLPLRNFNTVPRLTRVTAYGTVMFELASLVNQYFGSHLAYSSYTMPLTLACHRLVQGWDSDVIAEDHHMFCKCYFAAMWDSLHVAAPGDCSSAIKPKVELRPIFLPAISFLVEANGWWASSVARFQQARRHSQGVAELGYVLLQYVRLMAAGFSRLSIRAHRGILSIAAKMFIIHIFNSVQAFSVVVTVSMVIPRILAWVWSGGLSIAAGSLMSQGIAVTIGAESGNVARWLLVAAFGPTAPLAFLIGVTLYLVIGDVLEGRYTKDATGETKDCIESLTLWRRISLIGCIQHDMIALGEPVIILYGLIPVTLAAWSLLFSGTKFEYIVAAKPT